MGLYSVALTAPGAAEPMISRSVRVTADVAVTVVAVGDPNQVRTRVVSDDLTAPAAGQARVRVLSGTSGATSVNASVVDGPSLAKDVAPGTATAYAEVGAQTWSIRLSGGAGSSVTPVKVRAGSVYTLLALDGADGGVRLEPVVDSSGAATMPTGGVQTGGGGLAAGQSSSDGPLSSSALVALLALTAGSLLLLRRRASARP